jgi:hypothetical protein
VTLLFAQFLLAFREALEAALITAMHACIVVGGIAYRVVPYLGLGG